MQLREMTPAERRAAEERRAEARETLGRIQEGWVPGEAALAAAPFLNDWEERTYPGTALTCLAGDCHGHPILGSTWVMTSPILHRGDTWMLTESRLYILGTQRTETHEDRLRKVLSGRRGAGRPLQPVVIEKLWPEPDSPEDDLDHLPTYKA